MLPLHSDRLRDRTFSLKFLILMACGSMGKGNARSFRFFFQKVNWKRKLSALPGSRELEIVGMVA